MKKIFLLIPLLLFIFNSVSAQKLVTLADWEDNQNSYVGKTISMLLSYDQVKSKCQLRCCPYSELFKKYTLWKVFRWYYDTQYITINVPNKFFENNGSLLPNVTDGGKLIVTVYVYRGHEHKTPPEEGYLYNENQSSITLELVSIKRAP